MASWWSSRRSARPAIPSGRSFASSPTRRRLTVYTQDDPRFPESPTPIHDADLAVSWHHGIETVPTVIRVVDGVEVERTVGWHRDEWMRVTGVDGLGDRTTGDAARVAVR